MLFSMHSRWVGFTGDKGVVTAARPCSVSFSSSALDAGFGINTLPEQGGGLLFQWPDSHKAASVSGVVVVD